MSSTPAASETAPSAVAYILPAVHSKRVHTVGADGKEQEADDNPWVHMQLKDPFQQTRAEDGAAEATAAAAAAAAAADTAAGKAEGTDGAATAAATAAEAEEDLPKPEEVIKSFMAAKGELEWLMAMLNTLQEGRYLTVGKHEKERGPQNLVDLAVDKNSKYRRRATAAAAASTALSEGAAALRALGQKEDAFYQQVTQLQRYWKVRQEPPDSPYAYSVNLNLEPPEASSSSSSSSTTAEGSSSSAAAAADEAAMVGRGPVNTVYILKDPAGMLRVQVPAPKPPGPPTVTFKGIEELPAVYTGPAAIHALLLQQQRLNAWHMVVNSLDDEISHLLGLPSNSRSHFSIRTQQQQQQQAPQHAPSFAANGYITLTGSLSSLVLQAVAGAAGTAGEAVLLQQQQQQQRHATAAEADGPPTSGFLFADELDVGAPWQKAAAAAAATLGPEGSNWTKAAAGSNGVSSNGSNGSSSSLVPQVVVDPQLLSMRPLALEHLLITQLGHLVSSLRHAAEERLMAPIAYAAAARLLHERARQRSELLQHQQHSSSRAEDPAAGPGSSAAAAAAAAAAANTGIRPGSCKFGTQVSFTMCFSRWLAHVAYRDVLREQLDGVLSRHPGIVARYLSSTHSCVSALQLLRSSLPAAAARAAGGAGDGDAGMQLEPGQQQQSEQQRRQRQSERQQAIVAAAEAAMAAVAPSLMLLLSDWQLLIECNAARGAATPAAAAAAAGNAAGQVQSAADPWMGPSVQTALGVQLQTFPRVLEQLLQQLE